MEPPPAAVQPSPGIKLCVLIPPRPGDDILRFAHALGSMKALLAAAGG